MTDVLKKEITNINTDTCSISILTYGTRHVMTEAECSDVVTSQRTPRIVSKAPGAGKRCGRILPLSLQRENRPADNLISDFSLQDSERVSSCCVKPPTLWSFVIQQPTGN